MKSRYSLKSWFQFRLRTFALMFVGCGLLFGWLANENSKHEKEVVALNKLVTENPTASYQVIRGVVANPSPSKGLVLL